MKTYDHRLITRLPHGERVPLDVLRQWTESGSVEAALKAMAKQEELPHWGSKGAINRAGDALRAGKLEPGQAAILESWRMAHRDVINSFQSLLRARAKNLDVQVAQRLKRRSTIIDKLSRHDGMQLARMDDVAGWVGDHIEADHIILHIGKKNGFKLYQFDLELEASSKLLELEKEFPEDNIVLVGARNVEEVKSAFRNYFNDVRDFLGMMVRAYEILDPETHAARM